MLNSFFEKLRSPAQPQQHQEPSTFTPPGLSNQSRPDQEEDGFLLVGETASERNTVMPTHHASNTNSQGYPPTYSQVQQSANYPVHSSSGGAWSSHLLPSSPLPTSSQASSSNQANSQTGHSPTYATLITKDIPFQLSEQLHFAQKLSTDMSYFAVPHLQSYNPSKYCYDFEEERRVLREMAESGD